MDTRPPDDDLGIPPLSERARERLLAGGVPPQHTNVEVAWQQTSTRLHERASVVKTRTDRWAWARLAAGAAVVAGVAFLTLMSEHLDHDYRTTAGQRATITLVDGTQVTLAPGSHLHVGHGYGRPDHARDLSLDGEAYFAVVHDTRRPFHVTTSRATIADIGTVFDVQAYVEDSVIRVAVAQGSVGITAGSGAATLAAGDQAVMAGARSPVVTRVAVADVGAWAQGRMVFRDTPLPEVVHTLGRTFDLDITIADSTLTRETITASFSNLSADQILSEVVHTFGAHYVRDGRRIVIRAGAITENTVAPSAPTALKTT